MAANDALIKVELPGLKPLRSGKVRDIYDLGDNYLFVTTDRISAFDVVMKQGIPRKGEMLNRISAFWFDYLEEVFPNHLITADFDKYPDSLKKYEVLRDRSMLVKKVERVDVECIVRGFITGSAWKQYKKLEEVDGRKLLYGNYIPASMVESDKFPEPIFTPSTKEENGHDINISLDKYYELIGKSRGDEIISGSIELYKEAYEYAFSKGIIIADTKFEFGIDNGKLILIDEIFTPDSSRFWRRDKFIPGYPQVSFDKQYLRDWLKNVDWHGEGEPPDLPEEVIENTAAKYREAFTTLTGMDIDD
ncbi:MAG: phosphoribosylaminoimidazolesuccinocarboxamide synthase [candidate division Zixibacteria bacterium]|nr:phosphoribosylaminoimidazolesuccinocarboxamide synthase [candidate division Zixibacteria bacterium]